MLNLLLYWIELTTYLCLFYNILHSKTRKTSLHFLAFVLVTAIWFVYNLIAETPNPDTFCFLIIILCIIKEKGHFNLCWTVVFTLYLNVLYNISTYTYCCITKDPLPFDTKPHKILFALICILIIANLSRIKDQTYYLSTNHPVTDAIINNFYEHIPEHTNFSAFR